MAATPMMHLRGGHAAPHIQPPRQSSAMNNPRSATVLAGMEDNVRRSLRPATGTRGKNRANTH